MHTKYFLKGIIGLRNKLNMMTMFFIARLQMKMYSVMYNSFFRSTQKIFILKNDMILVKIWNIVKIDHSIITCINDHNNMDNLVTGLRKKQIFSPKKIE